MIRSGMIRKFIPQATGCSTAARTYPGRVLLALGLSLLLAVACTVARRATLPNGYPAYLKVGHRGARGLMPENTIPSMIRAVAEGANVIEVDIYATRDNQMLVAHDPYVNVQYTLLPNGEEIPKEAATGYVWRNMLYADIRKLDVGSKPYPPFPRQARLKAHMPLLGELIDSVEAYTSARNLPPVIYNIELKTSLRFDSLGYNAPPAEVVRGVMDVVRTKNIGNRFYIQSFDVRPLQEVYRLYPGVAIGFLTGSQKSFEENIRELGFLPTFYSPHYELVTPDLVRKCHQRKLRIVPWTVNAIEDFKRLNAMGVDGIITDYPDYFNQLNAQP